MPRVCINVREQQHITTLSVPAKLTRIIRNFIVSRFVADFRSSFGEGEGVSLRVMLLPSLAPTTLASLVIYRHLVQNTNRNHLIGRDTPSFPGRPAGRLSAQSARSVLVRAHLCGDESRHFWQEIKNRLGERLMRYVVLRA